MSFMRYGVASSSVLSPRMTALWPVFDIAAVVSAWLFLFLPWLTGYRFTTGDSISEYFPQAKLVVNSLLHGDTPWWNPLITGGQPLLGDPQSMLFTPHVIAGLMAGSRFDLHLFDTTTMLCLLAGAVAVQRFGKQFADHRALPILGAILFMAGGVASGRLQHVQMIVCYSILPMQVLAARNLCARPSILRAAALWLTLTAALLNPNQIVYLSAFALLPYVAFFMVQAGQRGRVLLLASIAGTMAILAASPMLAAALEFISLSNRPSLAVKASTAFSFPLFNLTGLVLPGLYGLLKPSHGLWSPTDASEDYIYVGLIPAALFLYTVLRPHYATALSLISALLAVFWFVFALGTNTPLYGLLFNHVPGLSGFRRPADAAFLMNFAIALLVATAQIHQPLGAWTRAAKTTSGLIGLALGAIVVTAVVLLIQNARQLGHSAELGNSFRQFGLRLAILCIAAMVMIALDRKVRWKVATPLIIGLQVLDLAYAGRLSAALGTRYAKSPTAQFYQPEHEPLVTTQRTAETLKFLLARGVASEQSPARIETLGGELAANLPMTTGVAITQGYNPLTLQTYAHTVGKQDLQIDAKQFTRAAPTYQSDIYRRLGLRYVLIPLSSLNNAASTNLIDHVNSTIRTAFTINPSAKRVGIVGDYEIWEMEGWMPKAEMLSSSNLNVGACDLLSYKDSSIRMRCRAEASWSVVIGDNDAPGWSACVNGAPVAVARYEGLFRQVPLTPGDNRVSLYYQPVPFLRHAACPA